MIIQFKIFREKNLIVQKISGDWDTNTYLSYLNFITKDSNYKHLDKIFTDFRKANLIKVYDELESLVNVKFNLVTNKFSTVHLLSTPSSTVISHLYGELANKKGHNYNYCTTIEQGINLLELNITNLEMEKILKTLKTFNV
ncbi:MAG: hypothetical protein JKY16_01290 [Lutibacter sp.]|nr:hypothetical protein [Lutibacter sp.]